MKQTKYTKIYQDIVSKIKSGAITSNEYLPSTRELASLYQCHRFTVMTVCQDLVAEGWIQNSERSRYKASVKIPITNSTATKKRPAKKNISKIANVVPEIDLERARYSIEFWGGQPDLRLFPKDEFRRTLSSALKRVKPDQLNYGLTDGLESCLKEVSGYLRRSRSITNKELIMTNGSQEALLLIFQSFVKPGDKIAVERKGYPPAWHLFESLGAILIPIEVDAEGLNTNDLKNKMRQHKIKLIYVTPLHQYPTTVTLSPRRRQSLIQLAEKHFVPILEDDYDNEFHFVGPPPPPISTETDLGIYVASFSKILFPGARLGVVACGAEIKKHIAVQKYLISRQTDCLAQIGLSAWIKDGGFEKHLRRTRRIYESRYYFMIEQLKKLQAHSNISWVDPNGGMSIWVDLKRNSKIISDQAKKKGVFFQYESTMDYSGATGTHLRIGFAGVNEDEIKKGFEVLKTLLK